VSPLNVSDLPAHIRAQIAPAKPGRLVKLQAAAARSSLEDDLARQITRLAYHQTALWVQQYKAITDRQWRWDFAFPGAGLLVEVDGGTRINGAHNRGARIEQDCEKQTAAAIAGWRTIRVTGDQVRDGRAATWIEQALHTGDAIR
jgi:very-short-patch-repair endonuclease